jgi:hypothetical protein
MNSNSKEQIAYEPAPEWLERQSLLKAVLRDVPTLVMLSIPGEEGWWVASRIESNAIADPDSLVGRLLRTHSGLMGLNYVSAN